MKKFADCCSLSFFVRKVHQRSQNHFLETTSSSSSSVESARNFDRKNNEDHNRNGFTHPKHPNLLLNDKDSNNWIDLKLDVIATTTTSTVATSTTSTSTTPAAATATSTTILKVPTSGHKRDQAVSDLVKSLEKEGTKAAEKSRKAETNFYPKGGAAIAASAFGMCHNGNGNTSDANQRALNDNNTPVFPDKTGSNGNGSSGSHHNHNNNSSSTTNSSNNKATNGHDYNRHYSIDACHRHEHQVRV